MSFYPEGGGSPGGLWAEEARDLTQVLRGALSWLLKGRQTVKGEGRTPTTRAELTAQVQVGDNRTGPGGGRVEGRFWKDFGRTSSICSCMTDRLGSRMMTKKSGKNVLGLDVCNR